MITTEEDKKKYNTSKEDQIILIMLCYENDHKTPREPIISHTTSTTEGLEDCTQFFSSRVYKAALPFSSTGDIRLSGSLSSDLALPVSEPAVDVAGV